MQQLKIGEHFKQTAAMKNLFKKVMLFAAAAMAFASCQNDGINDETITTGVEVTVNATTSDVSRSVFGDYNATDKTYPTLWSGEESWKVAIGDTDTDVNKDKIAFSDDRKAAIASFSINEPDVAESYVLYAVSPKAAYVSSQNTYIRFGIPSSQKPIDGSCDEAAQVLLAVSEPKESLSSFDINFEHATAYCKLSFLNIGVNDEVEGVSISAKDVKLAGRYEYTVATKTIKEQSSLADVISLETTNTTDLYFACAPVDVSGKDLTFTVHTDKGNLSKTVTMPENRVFKSGVVASLGIDMSGIGYPVATTRWERVTKLEEIFDGEYVIVDGTSVLTNGATQSAPAQIALNTKATVGDNVLTNVDESVIWTFTGSSDAMTIRSYANTANYLYVTNNNNGVRIGTTSDTWAFQKHGDDGFAMKDANNSRYCGLWEANLGTSNPDWRSYNTVNATNYGPDGACLTLYKKFSTDPMILASNIEVDEFGAENATVNYDVKHMDDNVTATSNSGWITASASNKTLTYSVESNYTRAARKGEIVLTCGDVTKTIVVSQAADKFSVSSTEIQLEAGKDATATFTVTSSYEYSVSSTDETKFSVEKGENNVITVTALSANDTTEPINLGRVVVSRSVDETTLNVDVSQKGKSATGGEGGTAEVVDVLDRAWTGNTTTSYKDWSGKTSISTAVYAGNSAGGNGSIQIRGDNSESKPASGVISTTSGGKVKKVTVKWNSNTAGGRTLNIFVSNTPYSNMSDLWDSSKQGTKAGTIVCGTSTTLTIEGDYEYIGLRSNSGAMYISEIQITWETGDGGNTGGDDSGNTGGDDSGNTGGGTEVTKTYTFSQYTAGTQYAKNEAHKLDDILTITTTDCHFTSELRIYASSTNNGYAIGKLSNGTIKSIGFNAGNKVDTLNVYGSTDGSNWTLVSGVSITSTSYKDYSLDFGNTNYTYFKLDVAGSNQVRLKSLTLTYID